MNKTGRDAELGGRIREHAAAIAGDVLRVRSAFDPIFQAPGAEACESWQCAVAALGAGIDELQRLAAALEGGAVRTDAKPGLRGSFGDFGEDDGGRA